MSENAPNHRKSPKSRNGLRGIAAATVLAVAVGGGVEVAQLRSVSKDQKSQQQVVRKLTRKVNRLEQSAHKADARFAQSQKVARVTAALAGVPTGVVLGTSLKPLTKLDGYGDKVKPLMAAEMKAATVKVVSRAPGNDPEGHRWSWQADCSGTKISQGAASYVLTAAHCVSLFKNGYSSERAFSETGKNVSRALSNEYGIVQPLDDHVAVPFQHVSRVSSVSSDLGSHDFALLRVQGGADSSFNAIPGIDADRLLHEAPKQGEQTVGYSMPGIPGDKLLNGKGIYLGTVSDPYNGTGNLDLIGITNADTPATNACLPGASGSSEILPSGKITGTLHYDFDMNGYPRYDNGGEPGQSHDGDQYALTTVLRFEDQTGTNLLDPSIDTICAYNTSNASTIPGLISGFNDMYKKSPVQPGTYQGGQYHPMG